MSLCCLLMIFSCREEYDSINKTKQESRAEQFFKNDSSSANSKNIDESFISSSVKKLEKLNNENNFVSKLSDQIGLPVWNSLKKRVCTNIMVQKIKEKKILKS